MSNIQNVPLIEREKTETKTYKMIFTTGIIIILVLMILHYNKGNGNYLHHIPPIINVTKKSAAKQNTPILCTGIRIINTSKHVPINKISIMNDHKKIRYIYSTDAIKEPHCKGGIIMTFAFKKPINITQIVIDTDMLEQDSINIVDTQVELLHRNKILWVNSNKMSYKRYNYFYFDDIKDYMPIKLNNFYKPNMSDCEQEVLLAQKLLIKHQ